MEDQKTDKDFVIILPNADARPLTASEIKGIAEFSAGIVANDPEDRKGSKDKKTQISRAILESPSLNRLAEDGHRAMKYEKSRYNSDYKKKDVLELKNRFMFEMKSIHLGISFWSDIPRRIMTLISSPKFIESFKYFWNTGDYGGIAKLVGNEIFIGFSNFLGSQLLPAVYEGIELFFSTLGKIFGLGPLKDWFFSRTVILGIFMVIVGCFVRKKDLFSSMSSSFWIVAMEAVKAIIVIKFSWYWSIPLCLFYEEAAQEFTASRKEKRGFLTSLWRSFSAGVVALPILKEVLDIFTSQESINPLPVDLLHEDYEVHDEFTCPITGEMLKDPVFLHGFAFERKAITDYIRNHGGYQHPITRRFIRYNQLAKPTDDFLQAFTQYLNTRHRIIQAQR
mmetsp:Transcript_24291/g.36439  ORF Transcript_24291/g.36439 Transcript_24291/m.36439 type:complete len:394 (-) Transcript_24291:211-1392(-)